MTRRRATLLVLAVLLVAMAGYYLASNLERIDERIDRGPTPDALGNPYLAAEHFLRGQGLVVATTQRNDPWASLTPGASSLMLLGNRRLSPAQVQQLLAWVRRGGRLVVAARGLWDAQRGGSGDRLLDALRIRRSLSARLPGASQAEQPSQSPDLTRLYLETETTPVLLGFNPAYHLEDPTDKAMAWANSRMASHLMQLPWGDGVITVLSDSALWHSDKIGDYDNAWLLWYLNQDRQVTLARDAAPPGWFALLWSFFAQALVAALVLVLAWCWHRGVRQGPLQPAPAPARRSLAEHLRASTAFTVRHGGQQPLLQALRQDIIRHAARHHPGFAKWPVTEQWQVLARQSGLPTASIAKAMAPGAGKAVSQRDFSERVAQLQRIRNAL